MSDLWLKFSVCAAEMSNVQAEGEASPEVPVVVRIPQRDGRQSS